MANPEDIDLPPRTIEVGTKPPVILSPVLAVIFRELYQNKNQICSRDSLHAAMQKAGYGRGTKTKKSDLVREHINLLRKKLTAADRKNYPRLGSQLIRSVSNAKGEKYPSDYMLHEPEDCSLLLLYGRYLYNRNTLGL